jgi:hypothetical protein
MEGPVLLSKYEEAYGQLPHNTQLDNGLEHGKHDEGPQGGLTLIRHPNGKDHFMVNSEGEPFGSRQMNLQEQIIEQTNELQLKDRKIAELMQQVAESERRAQVTREEQTKVPVVSQVQSSKAVPGNLPPGV